jgi:hypothetical protein
MRYTSISDQAYWEQGWGWGRGRRVQRGRFRRGGGEGFVGLGAVGEAEEFAQDQAGNVLEWVNDWWQAAHLLPGID